MEWGRQMAFVNHFYFYLWDREWGPAFIKTNVYAPWPIWIYLNGHESAKRQCDKAGIGYVSLDNGFRSCEDPKKLQRICDRLGSGAVRSFFWRWCHRLPSPFTRSDLRHGYLYQLAFRQFEVSDTRVFDRPQAGRAFFEGLIRDHLDVGRPDQVAIIFDRKVTAAPPGRFGPRSSPAGSTPSCAATTARAGSSSTSRSTAPCEQSWSSPTAEMSGSAGVSMPTTGRPSGPLAKPTTVASATHRHPTPSPPPPPTWSPSPR
jgi:hypothetical protein